MEQADIESILWDCVNAEDDSTSHLGYQSSGITKLAGLVAEQGRRISELEQKVDDLAKPTNEQ